MAPKLIHKVSGALTAILIILSLVGCATATPTSEPFATAAFTVCQSSPIQTSETGFSEIQGTMSSDGEMWALLFFGRAQAEKE